MENLGESIRESGARITQDPLPVVLGNGPQLAQVLQNLLGNAIKFRSAEPAIHVSARRQGSHWLCSIKDNGIGLDPRYGQRIFEIFQRLHTKDQHPGTGIGLAICRKIVECHGGKIWVESTPGQGATFHFTLRAA
jgi:chemotaxis family two-component system sensor kinase Cph1